MNINLNPQRMIQNINDNFLSPFVYLKKANEYLSNSATESLGREFIIRALDNVDMFNEHSKLLQSLVRKAGLYPYLDKYFKNFSDEESLVLNLYKSNFDSRFVFHSMQSKIYNLLKSGRNVVLSAPTSMGKSAIVDSLIAEDKFKIIVLVVPTIALIDETRRRVKSRFGFHYQIIHHGSQKKRKEKVVYILTQERVNERNDLNEVDIFIVDEFYKLAYHNDNSSRVISLNIALSKLLVVSKQFYMIGPYVQAIRGLDILGKEYTFIPSEFNTVALNVHEYNIAPSDTCSKNKIITKIIDDFVGQTVIYCQSQKSIDNVLDYLVTLPELVNNKIFETQNSELINYYEWICVNYGEDWGCARALSNGVGIHHGALPRAIQQKTVELFNSRKIKYLICTSTLIEGVNTSAKNIIIYDNRNGNPRISSFTHKNIAGRAGRMNQYLIGEVFCLETIPEKNISSQVVDLPLGLQGIDTPINLLASIQPEHLTNESGEYLDQYNTRSNIPIEIIKNNFSYSAEDIVAGFEVLSNISTLDFGMFLNVRTPNKKALDILVIFIKKVEMNVLARYQFNYDDNDDLQNRLGWYIYSQSYSEYIQKQIKYIYNTKGTVKLRSEATDKELKVVRNIFKHAIPRALMLFEDLLNYISSQKGLDMKFDLGYLIHIFENSHLPSSFSALEELGIPIETLEKLLFDKLRDVEVDVLLRYIRLYGKFFENLNDVDNMFIKQAVS